MRRPGRFVMLPRLLPAVVLSLLCSTSLWSVDFLRGDANADGRLSIADVKQLLNFMFSGPAPPCLDATDADDNGISDLADVVVVLQALFTGEREIPLPFPEIGPDPTPDDLDCRKYEISDPVVTSDVLRLGDVEALPGDLVAVPLIVRSSADLSAFQAVVRYDPAIFTPVRPEGEALIEATFRSTAFGPLPRVFFLSILEFPEEGIFRVGFLPSFIAPASIKRDEDQILLNLLGIVSPQAEHGSVTLLEFAEQETDFGVFQSEVTEYGEPRLPGMLVNGSITVKPLVRFVRGDSNVDGNINIADAIHMLRYMFAGGADLECRDAADVNDNGTNEISDTVGLLNFLFVGGLPPQDPWPECGLDKGDESIDCEGYPFCE